MNTTFIINGGAGRVITAIPALEKYARLNPSDNFKVLVHGWESLFWSHPILQDKTFSINQKGLFEFCIKDNKVVCPEPYYIHGYYNQKLSLAEAFDEEINKTTDHSDLGVPNIYLSTLEKISIGNVIKQKKEELGKNKIVVIQPYGSGMSMVAGRPFDSSSRSIDVDDYLKIIKGLEYTNKDILIFYFGQPEFKHPGDLISVDVTSLNPDLRFYTALINICDYFIGCDSVGQHIARSMNKPGLVVMGSTDDINVSYPDHFTIYRNKNKKPVYNPIRLSGIDGEFSDRLNDGIMKLTDIDIENIVNIVNRNIYE